MKTKLPKRIVSLLFFAVFLSFAVTAGAGVIYHLKINKMVERVTRAYIERGVKEAEKHNADLIIIELETPGGYVAETWPIKKVLLNTSIHTVAWINENAISAGSLIAFACDDIIMAHGGSFGAAVPYQYVVTEDKKIAIEVDKKFQQVFLKQYVSTAKANGHNPDIARAMVTSDHDDITYEEYGIEPPKDMKAGRRPVEMAEDEKRPWMLKLLKSAKTEADTTSHFLTQRGEILVLDHEEAADFGVTIGTCSSIKEMLDLDKLVHLQNSEIVVVSATWSESVTRFLSSPLMTILLIIGTVVGISTELKMPGFGFPGITGLACLALLFFSRLGVGAAQWTDVIILIIGIALLGIELFVIPGFGVVGFAGIICIFVGIFKMLYSSGGPGLPVWEGIYTALWQMTIGVGSAFVVMFFIYKYITPETPLFGRLILGEAEFAAEGYTADRTEAKGTEEELIGKIGVTKSKLRPSGKAIFDDKLYDVISQGDIIDAGEPIRILDVKGNRIVVKKIDAEKKE